MIASLTIGILALHGAFKEHKSFLTALYPELNVIFVKNEEQLLKTDGLIIPGGESTTMGLLAEKFCLLEPLKKYINSGKPIFGTCAGLILLSNDFVDDTLMEGQKNRIFGGLDIKTYRNYFGSQVESFSDTVKLSLFEKEIEGVFIRAPAVIEAGKNVSVLGTIKHKNSKGEMTEVIIAVKQGNILCTCFHPELSKDNEFHEYFLKMLPNNETLAYRRISNISKPILLFLHGQMTTSSWFYDICTELYGFFDMIFIDMRGYGRSSYNFPINSIEELANDVFLFVNKLGINKNLNLLGFSLGGAVALQFACKNSELLDNLILVSTTGITGFPIHNGKNKRILSFEEMSQHPYFKLINEKMQTNDKEFFHYMFSKELAFLKEEKYDQKILEMFIDEIMLQRNLVETAWASNSFNISNEHNVINQGTNQAKNIDCRTILIHGSLDKNIPFLESEKVYKTISSKEKILEIIEGVDHYAVVNQAKLVAELIKQHIK